MERRNGGRHRASVVPLPTAAFERVEHHIDPTRGLSATGRSLIVLIDADGPRGYGLFTSHDPGALRALDVWLDSKDAANEDADGRLAA